MQTNPVDAAPRPLRDPAIEPLFDDLRFRRLLGEEAWKQLPLAVQRRFSKRLAGGRTVTYVGTITQATFSRLGWGMAQALRLIGGPLPTSRDIDVPFIVSVTEDTASGGQIWTRICARRDHFPQVIHSSKRFCGHTGIEEYVGLGLSMALTIAVKGQSLVFESDGYFAKVAGWRLRLPDWVTPGRITVMHTDLGDGRFEFTLNMRHPRFGLLIDHIAVFREANP